MNNFTAGEIDKDVMNLRKSVDCDLSMFSQQRQQHITEKTVDWTSV